MRLLRLHVIAHEVAPWDMPPRPLPTHFLCIPLVTAAARQQLSASLSSFKADVTSSDSFGVPDGAIRPIGTLHLTLGVMSFPRNEGLEGAVTLLKTLIPQQMLSDIRRGPAPAQHEAGEDGPPGPISHPLSVTLKGLHTMQSAAKASVLYAPPLDEDGLLTQFCRKLQSIFQDAELMVEDTRPLLLHATILNTIYVKGRKGKKSEKLWIDARQILDRYDDYVWMENVPIEKIAICKMGAKKLEDGDEAYEVEAEIDMI